MLILETDLAVCVVDPPVVDLSFACNLLYFTVYVAIEVVPPVPSPSLKSYFFFFVRLELLCILDGSIYGSFTFFLFTSFILVNVSSDASLEDWEDLLSSNLLDIVLIGQYSSMPIS